MFEAAEELQMMASVLGSPFFVSHAGLPQVLIQKGNVLLNRNGEVPILARHSVHPLSTKVLSLVQNDIYAFFKVASLLVLKPIQGLVKVDHRVLPFSICPFQPILYQFKDAVLHEHHAYFLSRNALLLQLGQILVNSIESEVNGSLSLIVHAHADENLYPQPLA